MFRADRSSPDLELVRKQALQGFKPGSAGCLRCRLWLKTGAFCGFERARHTECLLARDSTFYASATSRQQDQPASAVQAC